MSRLRILVADDHDVIRQGVISLIKATWVGGLRRSVRWPDRLEKARELKPDIVIIDVGMPLLNGLDATAKS